MKTETRWIASLLLAPIAGFLCFVVPIAALGGWDSLASQDSSTSLVSRVFENAKLIPTVILLVLAGFGLARLAGRGAWILPLLLISVFPIAAGLDVITKPTSHNLLPFEVAIQLAFALPALVGAHAALALLRRREKSL